MKLLSNGMVFLLLFLTPTTFAQSGNSNQIIPELIFKNPVLIEGTAGQDGAVYNFSNVAAGMDANVKIIRRSGPSVVLTNIDVSDLGWTKAFQPQLGIAGDVPANQEWWMEFQLKFVDAGTNNKKKIKTFYVTTLDTDGDNVSIKEFIQMEKIKSGSFSSVTYLTEAPAFTSNIAPTCSLACTECNKVSLLVTCGNCNGSGVNGSTSCGNCKGSGKLYDDCDHAWEDGAPLTGDNNQGVDKLVRGPVMNFIDIDTLAGQVMATYVYEDKDLIRFKIGAKSGTNWSNAGERLNSLWFKQFSLAPLQILPVKLNSFTAVYDKKNVMLDWTTGMEVNFSHYVLERSTDGKIYSEIAVVFANGNTQEQSHYHYKDPNINVSVVYYRIRFIEMSGEASYSKVCVIRVSKQTAVSALSTYPNPVTDVLKVSFPPTWQNKEVLLEIFNANGIKIKTEEFQNASQTETIPFSQFSRGFYIIKASSAEGAIQQRVIKN